MKTKVQCSFLAHTELIYFLGKMDFLIRHFGKLLYMALFTVIIRTAECDEKPLKSSSCQPVNLDD